MFRFHDPHRKRDRDHRKIVTDNLEIEARIRGVEAFFRIVGHDPLSGKEESSTDFDGFQDERTSERRRRRAIRKESGGNHGGKRQRDDEPPLDVRWLPTNAEKRHFGGDDIAAVAFAGRYRETVRELRGEGIKQAWDIARHLNRRDLFTLRGDRWNARLVRFLLSLIYRKRYPNLDDVAVRFGVQPDTGYRKGRRSDCPRKDRSRYVYRAT